MALPAKRARMLIDCEPPPEVPDGLITIINDQIKRDCRSGNSYTPVTLKLRGGDVVANIDHHTFTVQHMDIHRLIYNLYCVYSREYVVDHNDLTIVILLPISTTTLFYEMAGPWDTSRPIVRLLMFLATEYKIDVDDILRAMGTVEVARGIYMARELQIRRDVTKQKLAPLLQRLCRDLVCVVKSFL